MVTSSVSLGAPAPVLAVVDGIPTTTSLEVARQFNRPHDEVLRRIRNLLAQLPAEHLRNFAEMFHEVEVANGAKVKHPAYRITRDGFTLLAMGFTGKKALQFKLAYIDAFNKMEAQLAKQSKPALTVTPPRGADQIREALNMALVVAGYVQQDVAKAVLRGDDDWMHQRYLLSFITDSKHCTPAVVEVLPADAVVLNQKDVSALMGEAFASAWLAMQKQVDQQIHKGART